MGEALFHITVVLERKTIAERVRAGMDRARAEGKHVDRPRRTAPITEHRQWPLVVAALGTAC
jgi:DNA invertase Pin-like site-specific DNA recombinase